MVAYRVDEARDAPGIAVGQPDGFGIKGQGLVPAGHGEPVRNVSPDFVFIQRAEVVPHRDPLPELAQGVILELGFQLRLADEDDLDQLLLGGFQV